MSVKFYKCQAEYQAQARTFRHLANEHNFWNRSTVILSRSLKESFSGNFVKIFVRLPGIDSVIGISILVCSSSFVTQISNPT